MIVNHRRTLIQSLPPHVSIWDFDEDALRSPPLDDRLESVRGRRLRRFPADGIDVRVERLGRSAGRPVGVRSALTERRLEVVQAALEVDSYETPRRATAADVADRLGCTASTASEYLRKAEARVIRELFDG